MIRRRQRRIEGSRHETTIIEQEGEQGTPCCIANVVGGEFLTYLCVFAMLDASVSSVRVRLCFSAVHLLSDRRFGCLPQP